MKRLDHLKRSLAYCLLASVLLGAGLGIMAVLRNQWSWFEVRVLLSTAVLAAASLCGLACDHSRTPRGLNMIPYTGLALTLLATGLVLTLVWWDTGPRPPLEALVKSAWAASVFAIATAHFSLLSVARLSPRFQWTLGAAFCVIYALASLLAALVVLDLQGQQEHLFRSAAVLAILAVAISLVIPLLHRISHTDPGFTQLSLHDEGNAAALDAEIDKLEHRLDHLRQLRKQAPSKSPETSSSLTLEGRESVREKLPHFE